MEKFIENNVVKDEINDLCIICFDSDGTNVLCSSCKYKYCSNCAGKINNSCSICVRKKKFIPVTDGVDLRDYTYIYEPYDSFDDYDYGTSASVSLKFLFTLSMSILFNMILSIGWVVIGLFFGYVGLIFIYNILYKLGEIFF